MEKTHKWEIVLEDSVDNDIAKENLGIISNGERFLFFRVREDNVCYVYANLADFLFGIENFSYDWTAENDESLLVILNDEQTDIDALREINEWNGIETLPEDEAWFIPRIIKRGACLGARRDLLGQRDFNDFELRCRKLKMTGKDFVRATIELLGCIRDEYAILEPTLSDKYRELIVPDYLIVLTKDENDPARLCMCTDQNGMLITESYDGTEEGHGTPNFAYLFYYTWVLYAVSGWAFFNKCDKAPERFNDLLEEIAAKPEGTICVKAMNAYLHNKKRISVEFEEKTYADDEDIQLCRETGTRILEVSLPSDGSTKSIIITVVDPKDEEKAIRKEFNGREDEDFENIFREVYDYIRDDSDPEAEEYLETLMYE